MELDKLKKSWQQAEIKSSIDEDKIQRIINNRGKSAFNTLLKLERISFYASFCCIFFAVFIFFLSYTLGIVYSLLIPVAVYWQSYKIRYLKKTDFVQMNVLEISKHINKYKLFIKKELIAVTGFVVVFFGIYAFELEYIFTHLPLSMRAVIIGASVFITVLLLYLVYRFLYMDNIKKIEQAIKEVEDFEKEG